MSGLPPESSNQPPAAGTERLCQRLLLLGRQRRGVQLPQGVSFRGDTDWRYCIRPRSVSTISGTGIGVDNHRLQTVAPIVERIPPFHEPVADEEQHRHAGRGRDPVVGTQQDEQRQRGQHEPDRDVARNASAKRA